MRHRPRLYALLGALLLAVLAPAGARAHGTLQRSRPAAGATLREVPRQLRLEFNEAPELAVSSVRLLDADRREIALLPLRTAADSLRVLLADIRGALAAGRYTVHWQIAGRDGHPVRGQFEFVIAAGAMGLAPAPPAPVVGPALGVSPPPRDTIGPASDAATFGAESLPYVVVRWAQFAGLLIVIGAMSFRWLVLGRTRDGQLDASTWDDAAARARQLAGLGALLLAASSVARLFAQWIAMRVVGAPSAMPMERVVWETSWGHAWVLQAVALAVLIVGLLLASRARSARAGWAVATLATIALAVVPGLSGHAVVSGDASALVADAVHVLAAGGWMGGLFVLLLAGVPATRTLEAPRGAAATSALVNAFSPTALAFAALVVGTGVVAAWRNVGSLSALLHSRYGIVLGLKLGALGVAAFIGLYNWRRARPALTVTGDDAPIRRAMRAELVAGVVVLVITAILVAIPTPADLVRMR